MASVRALSWAHKREERPINVQNDEVVELVLNGVPGNREELRRYGLSEEIINYKRRWFVLSDEAATTLPILLTQRKPIRDLTAADAPDMLHVVS